MSKLNIDQKIIKDLFGGKKSDFLIPDYQRPYAWGEKECQTLWEDIFTFAFPNNNSEEFNSENDEYFLGPIVTFKNQDGKMEIIDGQQRLTTLMLLLRAFYDRYGMKLSITLDTLIARILKLSCDSQSRIEPVPLYSWWDATDCRADSAVAPVAHEISPDHRF